MKCVHTRFALDCGKHCEGKTLFKKFFDKRKLGSYSTKPNTVCGMFDKRKHGSYSTKPNTECGMLVIKLGNISYVEANYKSGAQRIPAL